MGFVVSEAVWGGPLVAVVVVVILGRALNVVKDRRNSRAVLLYVCVCVSVCSSDRES